MGRWVRRRRSVFDRRWRKAGGVGSMPGQIARGDATAGEIERERENGEREPVCRGKLNKLV